MTLHVVGLSGGHDSTTLALRLKEVEPREYVYVCTPTGDELPPMLAHWRFLESRLGRILQVSASKDLKALCDAEKALPSWRMRFCTPRLKIQPMQRWIDHQLAPVTLYVGLRADEEGREGGIYDNCTVRFPLREWGWGEDEVQAYLKANNIHVPARTDCARCFFQTLGEWWKLWQEYPEVYEDAVQDEIRHGHTYRSPSRDAWPASLAELRREFEDGRVPRSIRKELDVGFSANKCRVCSL